MELDNLAADVGPADLMAVVSRYPVMFRSLLAIFIIICVGYGVYWFVKKNKKSEEKSAE